MSEQNKRLTRRAIEEVWNRGNFAVLDQFVTSDIIIHGSTPASDIHGPEGIKQVYGSLRQAFPDLHFTIEDQVAEGDRVVTRWIAQGTHQDAFQGIPPHRQAGQADRHGHRPLRQWQGRRVLD